MAKFAHYKLDADVLDSEGNNDGASQGITFNDGAAVFVAATGSDPEVASHVELDHSAFHLQTFSFSFWVNPTTASNGSGRSGRWLASCMGPNLGWSLKMNSNRHLTFQQYSAGGALRQCITNAGAEKAVIGEWKHYVMTVSPSGLTLYANGGVASNTTQPIAWDMDFTGAKAYLGRVQDNTNAGGAADSFDGSLDDVQFFDHVLTAAEVTTLYNAGRPASLTQSEDSLATDLALELKFAALPHGATNDGNSTFEQDGDRTYVSFPTTTAMLTIQDASEYEYTTENFTVAFWMRPTSAVQGSWAHPFIMDSLGSFGGYYMFQEASVHNTYGFVGNANFQWTDPDPNMVMSVDTWTHLTIVREGTQSKIYINGQLDSTNPSDVAATIGWGGSQLMIGHQWIGDLSDFRIWSRALSAGEAAQVYAYPLDGSIIGDSGKTFVYVEALPVVTEGVSYASYQMTDTKKYIVRLENGSVYEGTTVGSPGDNGSWTKTTITDHGTGPLAPGGLCRAGNFWVTHKPSNRGLSAGEGLQTAWAAGLDAQGNAITPESWNLLALGGAEDVAYVYENPSEDRAFALTHPSQNSAVGFRSILWAANQASSSGDSLTWTKLNMSASSDHKAITAGILDHNGGAYNYSDGGVRIMFAAANASNQHVFVAEAANNLTSERGEHLLVYSGSAGWDNVVLTYADFPANARRLSKPVYFNSKWYVGEALGVLVSSDGISWSRKTLDFDGADVQIEHLAGDPVSGSIVAVGTSTNANGSVGVVAHSSDDGVSWVVDAYVESLSFTAVANVEEGVFVLGCAEGWIAFSNNDGHDWTLSQSIRTADVADVVSVQAVD